MGLRGEIIDYAVKAQALEMRIVCYKDLKPHKNRIQIEEFVRAQIIFLTLTKTTGSILWFQ